MWITPRIDNRFSVSGAKSALATQTKSAATLKKAAALRIGQAFKQRF